MPEKKFDNAGGRRGNRLRDKLAAVAEHTTNLVTVTDCERRIEWVNAAFCEKTGYSLEEVVGRNPADFLRAEENDPALMAEIDEAARRGEGITREVLNRTRSGELYWVELDVRPVNDDDGVLTGFVTSARDITGRKAAEKRLREASLFGAMLEESLNEVYILDPKTLRFLDANRGARENLGYSLDQLKRMTVLDINPYLTDEIRRQLDIVLRHGSADKAHFETRHRRSDGSVYDVEAYLQLSSGDEPKIICFILDITARKQAEAEAESARQQLSVAIETLPDGFVLYDADDRLVVCNGRYRETYPESAAAMVPGARFEDILRYGLDRGQYADAVGREEEWLAERLEAHSAASTTLEQKLGNGRWLRIVERATPDGGRVGLRIDITDQLESRARAERAEQLLRDAISALPAAFWLFDRDDRLVMFNERYREMFCDDDSPVQLGARYESIVRSALGQLKYRPGDGSDDEVIGQLLEDRGTSHYEREYQLNDGRWFKTYNEPTTEGGHVGFGIDVTELRVRQDKLQQAALTDPLTGLANRRGLAGHLDELARRADPATRVAIMHIDLDKFKAVNDLSGHDAGDHVLKHCARVLRSATRGDDLVARVGGDEFVVICDNADDDRIIAMMADRFVTRLSAPVPFGDKTCHIGASVGIAHWMPAVDPDVQARLTDADIALNQSKRKGRGRFHFFEDGMRSRALLSAELAQEIYDGLNRDEFEPWFQPQFDIGGERVTGFEALIRWNHPARGLMTPGDFLFAAEEANLMDALDQRMLEKSCAAVSSLEKAGVENARISVNLTGPRLGDPAIVGRVRQTAESFGVKPQQLVLEILESALLDERSANVEENMDAFVDAGFAVELDDFGTGHAAIASLRKFPLERIKLDRSLIAGIDRDPELVMITSAITNLAKSLGLKVLAEGVETDTELMVLRQVGCTCLQGFYFARPMPVATLLEWLGERRETETGDKRAASA